MCFPSRTKNSHQSLTIGQLLNSNFTGALLLLKSSQKENKFGRTDYGFVFLSVFSLLWS